MAGTLSDRFWAKVDRGPECWEWLAARDAKGYGALKIAGRVERAHRVSWFLAQGSWPEGEIRLRCGNPGCVRPEHLVEEKLVKTSNRKRAPKGASHVARRGQGWRIIVTAGRDPVTGKVRKVTRTVRVATEAEARVEAARLRMELADPHEQASGDHTFGELLEAWLRHAGPSLEPSTAAFYAFVAGYVTPALRAKPVRRLTAEDLDALYRWLLNQGTTGSGSESRKGKPLSARSVRAVHTAIRLALAQAKKWRWVSSNAALDASPPAPRKPEATPPTPGELLRLLALTEVEDPEFHLLLRLAATAGSRRGELCGLRWPAISLDQGTLHVLRRIVWNEQNRRWEERQSTKTGRNRALVLGPRTVELLLQHRARMTERARRFGVALPENAYVFSDAPDCSEPWSPARVTRRFKVLRHQAALPAGVRFQDLRVFLSTQLQEGGYPLAVVSGRLGHTQYSTTLDHYTGWMPEADRRAANYMDDLIDARLAPEAEVATQEVSLSRGSADHADHEPRKRR